VWIAFQPILRAEDMSVYGFEALSAQRGGDLAPARIVSRRGRAPRPDARTRRTVRNTAAAAIAAGDVEGTMFVNIHALDLLDEHLTSPESPLSAHAGHVVLELTERVSLEGIPNVRARVRALRSLGYRIAVDDLGAGYAGLSSFVALEPDIIKLDISLVQGVYAQPTKQKLIRSMAQLGRDLGILTVAEGIGDLGGLRGGAETRLQSPPGILPRLPERQSNAPPTARTRSRHARPGAARLPRRAWARAAPRLQKPPGGRGPRRCTRDEENLEPG